MKPKNAERLISIIFSLVGLVFLIVGIGVSVSTFSKKNNFVEHSAVISGIEPYRNSDGETSHRVYVEYTVNGIKYNEPLGFYSSSMRTGKKITIYYDPGSPGNIMAGGGAEYFILMFPGMGALFFIIGISMAGAKMAKANKRKKLMINGELINAEFVEVAINRAYSVNNRHPYTIICKWTDSTSQTTYSFKGENLWDDPLPAIQAKGVTSVPVYIERYNPKKYYVAVDDLLG